MLTKNPLFPGSNELDLLFRIHSIIGTPTKELVERLRGDRGVPSEFTFKEIIGTGFESLLPNVSNECLDLLGLMLTYDPVERITAKAVLKHPYVLLEDGITNSMVRMSLKKSSSVLNSALVSKLRLEDRNSHAASNIPVPVRFKNDQHSWTCNRSIVESNLIKRKSIIPAVTAKALVLAASDKSPLITKSSALQRKSRFEPRKIKAPKPIFIDTKSVRPNNADSAILGKPKELPTLGNPPFQQSEVRDDNQVILKVKGKPAIFLTGRRAKNTGPRNQPIKYF